MTANVLDLSTKDQSAAKAQPVVAGGIWQRWTRYLLKPIDGASLAVFRICFGLCVIIDLLHETHLVPDFAGKIAHFSFVPGMQAFPGIGSVAEIGLLTFFAAGIALGFFYRVTTASFLILYAHFTLLDKAYYQPQFYAISLLALLFCAMPANRVWSLDSIDRKQSPMVPRWSVLILQFQFAVIYLYSGVSKLHSDWMIGYPQSQFIQHFSPMPVIGPVVSQPWMQPFLTYGGIASDFLLATILFWGPAFWLGVGVAVVTYVINFSVFAYSILPWLMVASLGLYARPDWPRSITQRLRLPFGVKKSPLPEAATSVATDPAQDQAASVGLDLTNVSPRTWLLFAALHVYALIQILMPLQQFRYPGNPAWSERGTRFAWYTVTSFKRARRVAFTMTDPKTGKKQLLDPSKYLSVWQFRGLLGKPELIRELAVRIADDEQRKTGVRPIIHAHWPISLNDRPLQPLINPAFDLATPGHVSPAQFIVPLRPAPSR